MTWLFLVRSLVQNAALSRLLWQLICHNIPATNWIYSHIAIISLFIITIINTILCHILVEQSSR